MTLIECVEIEMIMISQGLVTTLIECAETLDAQGLVDKLCGSKPPRKSESCRRP
jgi:hypothetical protein